jgi:hypothetical protein
MPAAGSSLDGRGGLFVGGGGHLANEIMSAVAFDEDAAILKPLEVPSDAADTRDGLAATGCAADESTGRQGLLAMQRL